jgi:large subunit ribosomal protein L25
MALVELAGRNREDTGKGAAHRLRGQGLLPGIVYGPGENVLVAIERRSFEGVLRKATEGTVLIDLSMPKTRYRVLIKEVQRDPATSEPLHVDFLHISMDKPIHIAVPVHLVGLPEGVKNEGGLLEHVLRDLEVECLPSDVPEFIELDVSGLRLGQAIHARDVVRERVQVLTPADRVIASVHGRVAELEVPAAAEAAAPVAEGEAAEAATGDKKPAAGDKKAPAEKEGKGKA